MATVLTMKSQEIINPLLNTGLSIIQRPDMFNFSLDSTLLAHFAKPKLTTTNLIDLGCGNAAVLLFLSQKTEAALHGVEIQQDVYALAKRNVALNDLNNRITIVNDDVKHIMNHYEDSSFDMVLCNPPFFKHRPTSNINDSDYKTIARHEVKITLDDLLEKAATLLKQKGRLIMVHRASRLAELFESFKRFNLSPSRMRLVYTRAHKNASMVLIEGMYQSNATLTVEAPFIIHADAGYSAEYLEIFNGK